jgi:hypothetical protein
MRISQNTEWALIAALVLYLAFTPGFPVVRQLLSTDLGKALGLAAIVATWKYVSPVVALLLTVNFVRCARMREYMENPTPPVEPTPGAPPNTYCPENYTFDNGQCKNIINGQTTAASVCMTGQTWDGNKCVGSSAPPMTTTPEMPPPPPSTSSTTTKQPFTNMTPSPIAGGVQPELKEKYTNLAPANF